MKVTDLEQAAALFERYKCLGQMKAWRENFPARGLLLSGNDHLSITLSLEETNTIVEREETRTRNALKALGVVV